MVAKAKVFDSEQTRTSQKQRTARVGVSRVYYPALQAMPHGLRAGREGGSGGDGGMAQASCQLWQREVSDAKRQRQWDGDGGRGRAAQVRLLLRRTPPAMPGTLPPSTVFSLLCPRHCSGTTMSSTDLGDPSGQSMMCGPARAQRRHQAPAHSRAAVSALFAAGAAIARWSCGRAAGSVCACDSRDDAHFRWST